MIRVFTSGSKLCACSTRPAEQIAKVQSVAAQLAKGGRPPFESPQCRLARHVEPVAGSTPPAVRL
jgi:hypothetical protein